MFASAGLSLEEVAQATGVAMETAKSRLRYARAALRQALAGKEWPMSDRDAAPDSKPDPIDEAYVRAEVFSNDGEARAARRARILGAIDQEAAVPPAVSSPPTRRPPWRPWRLAGGGERRGAKCRRGDPPVPAGSRANSRPSWRRSRLPRLRSRPMRPHPRQRRRRPPPAVTRAADARRPGRRRRQTRRRRHGPRPSSLAMCRRRLPSSSNRSRPPPPPPPVPFIGGYAAAPTAPAPGVAGLVGGPERDGQVEAAQTPRGDRGACVRPSREATRRRRRRPNRRSEGSAGPGRRRRRPDTDGETALMKSIEADHPAVAALLRRHGASLDARNHSGERAGDMAIAKDDPKLNEALGLGP